jgi:chromosome segregation ATPase
MLGMSPRIPGLFALAFVALVGCQNQQQTELVSPSSDQPGYASRYPDEMSATRGRFSELESRARRSMGTFAGFPDELNKPNWDDVLAVYNAADAAGHSAEFVERAKETETVQTFFTEEKQEISMKVGGAANYTAKQKGCNAELSGATSAALDKAVEKQLEKRLRERNEAHRYIDDHEESIGKPNREKLEKQADEISLASYVVKVAAEETKRELEAQIAEANDVKSTLDRTIEESKTTAADSNRSDSEKKKAQARQEAAQKAKDRVDNEVTESQKMLEELDKRIQTLREEYDKAFDELKKKVEEKKSAEPAKPTS